MMGCVSALEMACWDIVGKEAGKPIYKLLGGQVHEKLRTYTYLYPRHGRRARATRSTTTRTSSAECAAEYVEQGFTAVKLDPAGALHRLRSAPAAPDRHRPGRRLLKPIREAVGTQGRHPVRHARPVHRVGRAAHGARPRALRSAVVRGAGAAGHARSDGRGGARHLDPDRHRRAADHQVRIRRASSRPAPPPSCSPTSAASAASWKPRRSPRWPRPTTSRSRRTATADRSSAPPTSRSAACCPNFLILESIKHWDGFHAELLKKKIEWQDGYVIPSNEPGLGVELNEDVAVAHPYSGKQLHLEMTNRPVG